MAFLERDWNINKALDWIVYRDNSAQYALQVHCRALCPKVIAALKARANGNPHLWRSTTVPKVSPAWTYRVRARQWMRDTSLSAPELLEIISIAKAKFEEQRTQAYVDALIKINCAVSQKELAAWARRSDTWEEPAAHRPREPIPSCHIDELRQIDASGRCCIHTDGWDFLSDKGPYYYDICFQIAEIKKLWPPEITADPKPLSASQAVIQPKPNSELLKASDSGIEAALQTVYNAAKQVGKPVPNTKASWPLVRAELKSKGLYATRIRVYDIADLRPYKIQRRRPGEH